MFTSVDKERRGDALASKTGGTQTHLSETLVIASSGLSRAPEGLPYPMKLKALRVLQVSFPKAQPPSA